MKHVLVTGAAGFIGSHLVDALLQDGCSVTALDNFDPFYDPAIKHRRVTRYEQHARYQFVRADVRDAGTLMLRLRGSYDAIVHLAAKAGVRPSIADPVTYQEVNVTGTQNLLQLARDLGIPQFVFASSSSVYGINPETPWREDTEVLRPISPYASTKISGELLGHVYSHLYGIRFVALRFFTVYGPRQRPDLAIQKFARMMLEGQPIPVFGDGSSRRDYTYAGDIVDGIRQALQYDRSIYEVFNLGNDRTVTLQQMIAELEDALGCHARVDYLPTQPGDVPQTWACIEKARSLIGYNPRTSFSQGIRLFADSLLGASLSESPSPPRYQSA
jgi:UDP-glucuronate 4-epimerase